VLDHEELMAQAREYVVERRHVRELLREAAAETTRRYGAMITGRASVVEVDDEWARLVHGFAVSEHRKRHAAAVLSGVLGSGKAAAAWWDVPAKSGIEFARLGGLEVFRARGGFVTDDELRDIAEMPIVWHPPVTPRAHWWLTLRHPVYAWHGWRDRRRALAWEAGRRR
jgi:hypothetical protein